MNEPLTLTHPLPYDFGEDDFWPTPVWVTEALLAACPPPPGRVLEPAAGNGDLVDVLLGRGYEVNAIELRPSCMPHLLPRCHARSGDWLHISRRPLQVMLFAGDPFSIVTNPPFSLALEFAEACLSVGAAYVALLLPSNFPYSRTRASFNRKHPPTHIIHFADRPSFDGKHNGKLDCYWSVWEAGKCGLSITTATREQHAVAAE